MAEKNYFIFGFVMFILHLVSSEDVFPPPEVYEIINPLHEICTQKMGVTDDEVKNYDIKNNSHKMMCYMECLMKESKWMSEDGQIQYGYIKEYSHPSIKDLLIKALDKCMDIKAGSKECEKSYNFNVCMQSADPQHWFLP